MRGCMRMAGYKIYTYLLHMSVQSWKQLTPARPAFRDGCMVADDVWASDRKWCIVLALLSQNF